MTRRKMDSEILPSRGVLSGVLCRKYIYYIYKYMSCLVYTYGLDVENK